jgi:hypothetical protein
VARAERCNRDQEQRSPRLREKKHGGVRMGKKGRMAGVCRSVIVHDSRLRVSLRADELTRRRSSSPVESVFVLSAIAFLQTARLGLAMAIAMAARHASSWFWLLSVSGLETNPYSLITALA